MLLYLCFLWVGNFKRSRFFSIFILFTCYGNHVSQYLYPKCEKLLQEHCMIVQPRTTYLRQYLVFVWNTALSRSETRSATCIYHVYYYGKISKISKILWLWLSAKFSLFATFCNNFFVKGPKRASNVFLSHFIIKTGIKKNLDTIQISFRFSFQKCQQSRGPLLIDDVIITRLFWKFHFLTNH